MILIEKYLYHKDILIIKMKRKLIKQGTGGLTLYLPKKWIECHNLSPGDEIVIDNEDNSLVLSTENYRKFKNEITLHVNFKNQKRLRTILSSLYRRGYDIINLTSKERLPYFEIDNTVNSLIGFVLIKQSDNSITIQNTLSIDFEKVSNIIDKLFVTIKYLFLELIKTIEAITNNIDINQDNISNYQVSVMKLRDYCQRMIHVNKYEQNKSYEYNTIIFLMDKISNQIILLNSLLIKEKSINIENKKMIENIYGYYCSINTILNKEDLEEAINLNQKLNDLIHNSINNMGIYHQIVILSEYLFSLSSRIVGVLI